MTITLDTLAIGDVNYISKHNSNYAIIKSAIDALQASLTAQTGAVTNYPSFALAMAGAFVAKMQETDAVATDAGSAMLDISAGTVFHPSDSSMRTGALTTLDFTGQASDTYFTHIDKIGTWTFDTTGIDTVHTIVFTSPSTFTTITEPVTTWGAVNFAAAQLSAALGGAAYLDLDDRLEAAEGSTNLIHPAVITTVNVTLTTAEGLEHAIISCTGALTGNRDLEVPDFESPYIIINNCSGAFTLTVKTAAGTGVVVEQGGMSLVVCDGTNVVSEFIQGVSATGTVPYILSAWKNGLPGSLERVVAHSFPTLTGLTLPAGATNSSVEAETAATAETDFDLTKNDISIGTVRFAISGTVATFVGISEETFVAGDRLELIAPSSADATLAEVYFTFYLTRDD